MPLFQINGILKLLQRDTLRACILEGVCLSYWCIYMCHHSPVEYIDNENLEIIIVVTVFRVCICIYIALPLPM